MPVSPTTQLLLFALGIIASADGHGRMTEPPSRASMFRFKFNNPPNYNDNQLFCGGFYTQWSVYGGKCGVCGDPFAGPREHEAGGAAPNSKYANGIIVRKYEVGAEILVRIHLTANHKGYFEFRLCQNDDPQKNVTQACFDRHLLTDKTGKSRFEIVSGGPEYPKYNLALPVGVRCVACVLQWKYNTGNSWGTDFKTKEGCMGCGPQEQFYACADIAIGNDDVKTGPTNTPVEVPAGDVDEQTAWVEEEAKEAAEEAAKCNCKCDSITATSAGNRHGGLPVAAFVFFFLTKMLILSNYVSSI